MTDSTFVSATVLEPLTPHLVNHYTFDDPLGGRLSSATELDLGLDATPIHLLNGAPRVADGAWGGSSYSLETRQIGNELSNDDWKAGVFFESSAESTLVSTNHVTGVTLMGWFKPLGTTEDNPSPNTNTGFPFDRFGAFGLFGLLRGDEEMESTDGHSVRALIEVIDGRLVGLGRRLDAQGGSASARSVAPWEEVLPPNQWTHIAATFDYDEGEIQVYKNGQSLETESVMQSNWETTEATDFTSSSNAGGIKIGGSHPNNLQEQNPYNGRMDELMAFNRVLSPAEVDLQFRLVDGLPGDRDGDGDVDGMDFLTIQRYEWEYFPAWKDSFGTAASSQAEVAQSVPEPGTSSLALYCLALSGWYPNPARELSRRS